MALKVRDATHNLHWLNVGVASADIVPMLIQNDAIMMYLSALFRPQWRLINYYYIWLRITWCNMWKQCVHHGDRYCAFIRTNDQPDNRLRWSLLQCGSERKLWMRQCLILDAKWGNPSGHLVMDNAWIWYAGRVVITSPSPPSLVTMSRCDARCATLPSIVKCSKWQFQLTFPWRTCTSINSRHQPHALWCIKGVANNYL